LSPNRVSDILVDNISTLDDTINEQLLDLFPGGPSAISRLSDHEIRSIIEENPTKVHRAMQGSTVLVALINPAASDIWVASLGDCQAGIAAIATLDFYPSSRGRQC